MTKFMEGKKIVTILLRHYCIFEFSIFRSNSSKLDCLLFSIDMLYMCSQINNLDELKQSAKEVDELLRESIKLCSFYLLEKY